MNHLMKVLALPLTLAIVFFAISANIHADAPLDKSKQVENKNTLKLAKPKEYKTTAADKLEMNENDKGLKPGEKVKEFVINDMLGKDYPIKRAWQDKPALIIFYRGGWCPYCNMQVRELSVNYEKLKDAGVQPILISVNEPDKAALMTAQYEIPFPVLSDVDLLAHNAFNVVLTLDDATLKKYKEYGINLKDWSGKDHNSIAVASTFLINTDGKVLVSHTSMDYASRPSIKQLLELVDKHIVSKK